SLRVRPVDDCITNDDEQQARRARVEGGRGGGAATEPTKREVCEGRRARGEEGWRRWRGRISEAVRARRPAGSAAREVAARAQRPGRTTDDQRGSALQRETHTEAACNAGQRSGMPSAWLRRCGCTGSSLQPLRARRIGADSTAPDAVVGDAQECWAAQCAV